MDCFGKAKEYGNRMAQFQTNPRHSEEDTENSEIFASVLFLRNFADAKFRE